jgi:arylsulfatase A-like enzyme
MPIILPIDRRRRAVAGRQMGDPLPRFLLSFALLACSVLPRPSEAAPPNVLFIYLDDFGWKDAGFAGSDFYETPHLDALAEGGLVFTDAYSNAANCAPARASLLSGQYTPRHRIFNVGTGPRGDDRHRRLLHVPGVSTLDPGIVTWAEILQEAGYRTGLFGKWHLGGDPRTQGFDVTVEYGKLPGFDRHLGPNDEYLADVLTDRTVEFVRENRGRRWCAYLAHFAVHTPLQPKVSLLPKYEAKPPGELHDHVAMATMIQAVDDGVGRIVAELERLMLRDDTVIFFFSDNGGYGPATDMDPLWGYKGNYYEGGIRVPLFVNWPGVVAPGRSSEPVIGLDLFPTIVEIAGAELPEQPQDGHSLVPLLKGETPSLGVRPLFWFFPAYLQSYRSAVSEQPDVLFRTRPCSVVRLGDYKLHEYFEDGRLELYDLSRDIGERHNLAEVEPERTRRMHDLLKRWQAEVGAPTPLEVNPEFDAEAEAQAIRDASG